MDCDSPHKDSYYAYVIKAVRFKEVYKGSTGSLKARLKDHNAGGTTSTKRSRPWILAYYEVFTSELEARKREIYFKTAAGRRYLGKLDLINEIPFP